MIDKIRCHLADRGLYAMLILSMAALSVAYHAGLPSATFINVGDRTDQRYVHNFYDREQGVFPFRWTKDSSSIKVPELACVPTTIRLAAAAARPQGELLPTLTILANSTTVAHFVVQNEIGTYELAYSPPVQRCLWPRDLLLHVTSDTFDPPGEDARSLGVLLNTVEVTPTLTALSLHVASLPASLTLCLTGTLSLCFCYLLLRRIRLSIRLSALCCLAALALVAITVARRAPPLGPTFASLALLPIVGLAIVGTLRYLGCWTRILCRLKSLDERVNSERFGRGVTSSVWFTLKARGKSIPKEWWLLLALYLATRLTNLTVMPVFCDEAIAIREAQHIDLAKDPLFPLQTWGKLLLDWITTASLALSPDPLVSARLASVAAGALGMVGVYLVGKDLYSARIASLATALYVISPLMLFHERMLLADVMLNTCGLYVLLLSLLCVREGRVIQAVALGAAMALGMLSKLPGVFFLLTPLIVWALIHRIKVGALAVRLLPAYCTAALILAPVLLHPLGLKVFNAGGRTIATSQALTISGWMSLFVTNAGAALPGVGVYLTLPVAVMCGFSLLLALALRNKQGVLLWTMGAIPVVALLGSSSGFLPPRYFLFAVSPVLPCVAWSIERVSRATQLLLRRASILCNRPLLLSRAGPAVCVLLLAALSAQAARFDYYVLADPSQAPLPPVDRWQYVQGWPAGYGIPEAVLWLRDRATQEDLAVITDPRASIPLDGLRMYLHDSPQITIRGANLAEPLPAPPLGTQTFVVVDTARYADFALLNPGLDLVARFPKPGGQSAIDIYAFPAQEQS